MIAAEDRDMAEAKAKARVKEESNAVNRAVVEAAANIITQIRGL